MNDWRDSYPDAIQAADMLPQFEELSARMMSDEKPVVVESQAGDVVMLSAAEYRSIMETLHVFSSPANAERVVESIEQVRRGQAFAIEIGNEKDQQPTLRSQLGSVDRHARQGPRDRS